MGEFKGEINRAGRKAGVPNKKTAQARELVQKLFEDNLPTLEQDFKTLKSSERVSAMLQLMKFILPQLKAIEVKEDNKNNFQPIQIDFSKWK